MRHKTNLLGKRRIKSRVTQNMLGFFFRFDRQGRIWESLKIISNLWKEGGKYS